MTNKYMVTYIIEATGITRSLLAGMLNVTEKTLEDSTESADRPELPALTVLYGMVLYLQSQGIDGKVLLNYINESKEEPDV